MATKRLPADVSTQCWVSTGGPCCPLREQARSHRRKRSSIRIRSNVRASLLAKRPSEPPNISSRTKKTPEPVGAFFEDAASDYSLANAILTQVARLEFTFGGRKAEVIGLFL